MLFFAFARTKQQQQQQKHVTQLIGTSAYGIAENEIHFCRIVMDHANGNLIEFQAICECELCMCLCSQFFPCFNVLSVLSVLSQH